MDEEIKKVNGTWNGIPVNIKAEFGGHEFTADERTALFNGEIIEFQATSKAGNPYTCRGHIEQYEYNGKTYIGFKPIFNEDNSKVSGTWNGKEVKIKKEWGRHTFTEEELKKLFAGETISFETTSKNTGNKYTAKGKLTTQFYEGHEFVGFTPDFNKEDKKE